MLYSNLLNKMNIIVRHRRISGNKMVNLNLVPGAGVEPARDLTPEGF